MNPSLSDNIKGNCLRALKQRCMHSPGKMVAPIMALMAWVAFQWAPKAGAMIIYVCEGDQMNIMCPQGVVTIQSAKYGRQPGSIFRCGDNFNLRTPCKVDSTQLVKYHCEGQIHCDLYVDVATFNIDPCPDVFKYLEVEYQCVPPMTLAGINRCVEQCVANPNFDRCDPRSAGSGSLSGQPQSLRQQSNPLPSPIQSPLHSFQGQSLPGQGSPNSNGVARQSSVPVSPIAATLRFFNSRSSNQPSLASSSIISSLSAVPGLPYGSDTKALASGSLPSASFAAADQISGSQVSRQALVSRMESALAALRARNSAKLGK